MAEAPLPELVLFAPIDGVLVALDQLPKVMPNKERFAQGVAIVPTHGTLRAPCRGRVVALHRAHRAVSLRTQAGDVLLISVGNEGEELPGGALTPRVLVGDEVRTGQPLLSLDLELFARLGRSALTCMVVTQGRSELARLKTEGPVVSAQDPLLCLTGHQSADTERDAPSTPLTIGPLTLLNPAGLHARSAARLVAELRPFRAEVTLHQGDGSARASSIADLLSLNVGRGNPLYLSATGPDAAEALIAARKLIESGFGENLDEPRFAAKERFESRDPALIGGLPASPGVAIGRVLLLNVEAPNFEPTTDSPARAEEQLRQAIARVAAELAAAKRRFELRGEHDKAQIFAAHAELLADQSLVAEALEKIEHGASAPAAFRDAVEVHKRHLRDLKSPLLQQRAADLEDIGSRVVLELLGQQRPTPKYDQETVLVATELKPSDVAHLESQSIAALVTAEGGPTSHAAIIARSLSIPYVAGVGPRVAELVPGEQVIVNGDQGFVQLHPSPDTLRDAQDELVRRGALQRKRLERAHARAATRDGRAIEVAANVGMASEAARVIEHGADGIGLLRSEFLFLERRSQPSEEEQRDVFEAIGRALGPNRSLVVRTLDVGGDKPLAYLPLEPEENPFLGLRGIRLSLRYPELFDAQLRAILAAARHTRLCVMFPMVASLDEFRRAKARLDEQVERVGVSPVATGIMVEVPSAALLADLFAPEVDFFSIGTNDLTQYTLAVDRGHPLIGTQADALDPSVLRLIQRTAEAGAAHGKWVGVCGGLAAEPLAVPLLVGLGVTELSAPAPVVPDLKATIRRLRFTDCQALATEALSLSSAQAVRDLLLRFNA